MLLALPTQAGQLERQLFAFFCQFSPLPTLAHLSTAPTECHPTDVLKGMPEKCCCVPPAQGKSTVYGVSFPPQEVLRPAVPLVV